MDYGLDSPLTIVVAVIYFTSVSASPQLAWLVLVDNQTVPWSIVTVIGYATDARQPRAYSVNVPPYWLFMQISHRISTLLVIRK